MKQFSKILNFELNGYLKNKIFVGITLFIVLVIAVVMFAPRFLSSDTDSSAAVADDSVNHANADNIDDSVIYLKADNIDDSHVINYCLTNAFVGNSVKNVDYDVYKIEKDIENGAVKFAVVMNTPTSFTFYTNNLSINDEYNVGIVKDALAKSYQLNTLVSNGVSVDKAAEAMNVNITYDTKSIGKDQVSSFFYTYIMIFALYMVILLYGQMVATNVATEKSSRAMEVLITSAKPTSMMFGKVLASCIAGLIQLILVFGSALLCYNLNKSYWGDNQLIQSLFDIPPELLAYMLVFFVLGFLLYAFMFGAIGSTATKLEDINTSTMPVMFMFIAAFVVVMTSMASGDMDSTLIVACSYIPFTSPMAMFTRIALSTVDWYEIVISIAVLILSVIGTGVLSAKIYRVGVLLYGTTPKIGTVIKSLWKS